MSKVKHPVNIVLLTASEHFLINLVHICPTIRPQNREHMLTIITRECGRTYNYILVFLFIFCKFVEINITVVERHTLYGALV